MKRLIGIIAILCMVSSLSTSVLADRILLIPDAPKTPYRGGVGAYEGVVAHSTAT
ncbi:TPA: N-acetylmuramoyl-L-alanine amidase, partial [Bacillus cereus]